MRGRSKKGQAKRHMGGGREEQGGARVHDYFKTTRRPQIDQLAGELIPHSPWQALHSHIVLIAGAEGPGGGPKKRTWGMPYKLPLSPSLLAGREAKGQARSALSKRTLGSQKQAHGLDTHGHTHRYIG